MAELTGIRETVHAGAPEAALNASLGCGVPSAGRGPLCRRDRAGSRVGRPRQHADLRPQESRVLREGAGVLRSGGRLAVSDVIAAAGMDAATRADVAAWTGSVAGALTEGQFRSVLSRAGFDAIEIRETHRVHAYAAGAIVRARKAPG